MKIHEMVEFLKENYNVEVSISTVRWELIESNYLFTGPKIQPKNTDKKDENGERENYFKIGLKSSFLMRQQYILKPWRIQVDS